MKTKWILLVVAVLSGIVAPSSPAGSADLQPMVATPLTGNLHIHQDIPVCSDLDFDTPVIGGRIEIAPSDGFNVGGNKDFTFTRMTAFFNGFHTHVSCLGSDDDETYSEVGATLARPVTFTGIAAGGGVYNFTIPKDSFLVHEAAKHQHNSDPVGPESSFKHPAEDVTGFIDLTLGKVHLHVRINTKLHIEFAGISSDKDGSQTADIDGTIAFPDTDGDGVPDRSDNCKFTANPLQNVITTPVITAPPNLTLNSCLDHHIGFAAATDICNGRAVAITNDAPGQFAIGSNTVTWSGDDGADPVVTATQTVTIVDTTPPVITSVPGDVLLNDCKAADLGGLPTATDDCAGTVTFTNNAPPKFFVGTTDVTWTASDVSGNHSTAIQHVTVIDTVAPTVACVAINPTGNSFRVSATDACDTPTIRLGSFVLANGEVVKIEVTGQPGVRLINDVSSNNVRHFQVGKGENMITATDATGNSTTVFCR